MKDFERALPAGAGFQDLRNPAPGEYVGKVVFSFQNRSFGPSRFKVEGFLTPKCRFTIWNSKGDKIILKEDLSGLLLSRWYKKMVKLGIPCLFMASFLRETGILPLTPESGKVDTSPVILDIFSHATWKKLAKLMRGDSSTTHT